MLSANAIALDGLKQSTGAQEAINRLLHTVLRGTVSQDGPELSVRSVSSSCELLPDNWALCDHNILIHIEKIDSQLHIFSETRLDALAQALDCADPILCLIEALTGFILDPIEMVKIQPNNHAIFDISRLSEADRVLVAFPLEIQETSEFVKLSNNNLIDLSDFPVDYDLLIKTPILDIDDLADLSTGDLLILGSGATKSSVVWHGLGQSQFTIHGSYDFIIGEFASEIGSVCESIMNVKDETGPLGLGNATVFPVSVMACIRGMKSEAKKLAGIQSGTALDVGRLTQGTDVSLILGKKELFGGHLVKIGDHFAVSIDQYKHNPEIEVDSTTNSKVVS